MGPLSAHPLADPGVHGASLMEARPQRENINLRIFLINLLAVLFRERWLYMVSIWVPKMELFGIVILGCFRKRVSE